MRVRARKKKKLEFMQFVIILVFIFSIIWVSGSYILAWFDRVNPLENLGIGVISTIIAAILGYALQNCSRAKWFGDKTANDRKVDSNE